MRALKNKIKQFKPRSAYNKKGLAFFACAFALIGVATLLITRAATPGITVTVDSTLPNVTNLKLIPDDRLVTVTWDEPSNAGSKNIVGYYVTWGTQASGTFTSTKQTTYSITQLQPMTNGTPYNVKVQSVQGTTTNVDTFDAWDRGNAPEARANGKVSTGVTATVTPNSTRVDGLRTSMTGFFDDFNTASGGMDELKWNTATSACAEYGTSGAFINNQFHTHSQIRSAPGPRDDDKDKTKPRIVYCDRAQIISRPRAIFDISNATESNPGVIVGDFDGVTNQAARDVFYIDLVPANARTGGEPLDITGHPSINENEAADPAMIRFTQHDINGEQLSISTTGLNKVPGDPTETYNRCPNFNGIFTITWCDGSTPAVNTPYPELPLLPYKGTYPVPNVRQHYRWEITPTKLRIFVNSVKILEANMPSQLASIKQWTVQVNLFSYNTGKDSFDTRATTSLLHWDNFGFNGPAATTETHSYMEGGPTGTTPYLGNGTLSNRLPANSRTTKVPIPDPIGIPQKARVMFTLQRQGNTGDLYSWSSNDSITLNGHKYGIPDPRTQQQGTFTAGGDHFRPYATSVVVNASDLIQGMNTLAMNTSDGEDFYNVHIELVYAKGSAPAYTQPGTIFGAASYLAAIQPTMVSHDNYLFVEQDMGLPSGTTEPSPPPQPPTPPPTPPTVPPAPPTPPGKVGDINGDGSVGIADLAILLGNYNKSVPTNTKGDLNASGTVTTADLAILLGNYGK